MSERHNDTAGGPADEEERVARLLRLGSPATAVSPEIERRVHDAVREAWSEATGRRRRARWVGPLAAAASIAVVGLLVARAPLFEQAPQAPAATVAEVRGVFELGTDDGRLLEGDVVAPGALLRTSEVSRAALELPDGTSVRLDQDTELTLLSDRRIRLGAGAVYIDTGGEASAAGLTVITPQAIATDIGTQFEVRLTGGATVVRVREGEVDVGTRDESRLTRAGSSAVVESGGRIRTEPVAVSDASWDWTQQVAPPFDMADRDLVDFLDWAARELGLSLGFEGDAAEAAGAVRLTGSVEGLMPRDALEAVMRTTALSYRVERDRLIVFRP